MAGMFDKLLNDPYAMNMVLNGLGLLGTKTARGAEQYTGRISAGLLDQAKSRAQAKRDAETKRVNDSTLGLNQARVTDLQNKPLFDGTGSSVQAMSVASKLGAKRANGETLSRYEDNALRMAIAFLQQPKVFQTPDGTAQQPGLSLDFLNGPNQQPGAASYEGQPVSPGGPPDGSTPSVVTTASPPLVSPVPAPKLITQKDPLRSGDATRIEEAQSTSTKYSDMMPIFDAIEQDLAIYPTGKAAGAELMARQAGGIVGIGDEDTLAAGERLDKNMNKLVSQNMEFLVGAMSEGEREFTRSFSLSMQTSPEGNKAYIGFLRGVAKRASAKSPMMREYYRAHNNSLDGFDAVWKDYVKANPVKVPEIGGEEETPSQKRLRELEEELGVNY